MMLPRLAADVIASSLRGRQVRIATVPIELTQLPIDPHLPKLAATLAQRGVAVLQAEPGAGKTTRVPPWLLARAIAQAGSPVAAPQVWVIQPRRMAALLTARWMADEWPLLWQKAVGAVPAPTELIAHAVRFDDATTAQTRLTVMTDGLLLRKLQANPQLKGVGCVVLDEFHERRAAMDVALGMLRRLRRTTRPDLQILVMSATLDAEPIAQWLDDAPLLAVEGRTWPVACEHSSTEDQRPLAEQVRAAVLQALERTQQGNVLVFLPGAREIQRAHELLQRAVPHGVHVQPLHGSLPLAEQAKAIRPRQGRQVTLATNIAETSVTLPDVAAVVDTGLSRQAGHAAWSGLPTLQLGKIAKASAIQRMGRAGRTGPGLALRLYTEWDFAARPAYDRPEILRTDLADLQLLLADAGEPLADVPDADFWLDPPELAAWWQGRTLLQRLGALDDAGKLTRIGAAMRTLALPPRLARLCVAAHERGVGRAGATVAALLQEAELPAAPPGMGHGTSDVFALQQLWEGADRERLPPTVQRTVRMAIQQIEQSLARLGTGGRSQDAWTDLSLALLLAYPDRLARRRTGGQPELEMTAGSAVRLAPPSQVTESELLLVLDAEERREARGVQVLVRRAHGVDPLLLLEAFSDALETRTLVELKGDRVVQRSQSVLWGLVVEERERTAPPGPAVAAVLAPLVLRQGGASLRENEDWLQLQQRVAFAVQHGAPLPLLDDAHLTAVVERACQSLTRLSEARALDVAALVQSELVSAADGQGLALLDRYAPAHMTLPGGRKLRIHYEPNQPPWTASRLQDFFGLAQGPMVAQGRVAVVLHLLAPNQRPVQLTSDLAGFWQRHYPAVRKELARKYPRHLWPDDPLQAAPPPPNRPR